MARTNLKKIKVLEKRKKLDTFMSGVEMEEALQEEPKIHFRLKIKSKKLYKNSSA